MRSLFLFSFPSNFAQRDIPIIQKLGANRIMVSDNWAADGSTAHYNFLKLLKDTNSTETPLKLIVTFAIPIATEDMTPADYLVLRDRVRTFNN